MASSYTSNLNLEKPAPGDQSNEWGTTLNNNFDTIDTKLAIKDEDNMASDSASHLATQQSIKAYVDANALSLIDEDDMSTDSATRPPSQQSVKAYVDAQVDTEDTISELNDTNISSLAAGQLLLYHNTNGNWTNATLTAGSNVSITNADGSVTIASTDTNTQLTEEQVEDFVGGMVSGNTETGISVTYQDADGTLDFEVSDTTVAGDSGSTGITPGDTLTIAGGTNVTTAMSGDTLTITATDTNTQLSQEQVEDYVGGMLDGTETFIDVSYDDTDGNIDFVVPVLDEDDMSTDSASHLATQQSIKAYVDASAGAPAADNISAGDSAINLTTTAGNITIDAQGDDTDIILKGTDGGADTTFLTIDGSDAGTASFNHDIKLASDSAKIDFGADGEITLQHNADNGLILKNNNTADSSDVRLLLRTGETDIEADDVIGLIQFQAPDEATGGDAQTVCASVSAVSEGDFSSTSNATKLVFKTGESEAATEKMSLSSGGNLTVSGNIGIQMEGASPGYALQIATPDHTSATTGSAAEGWKVHNSGVVVHACDATNVYWFNDCSASAGTHNYILFRYQGSTIGDIDTTNNSTIRYNTFTGAHWSQFEDHSQPNIKLGTVMSSVSTLMKWTEFTYEDSEMGPMQWRAGGHDYVIGNTYTIPIDEDGVTASAKAIEHKTAKRLPMCKVSDTAGDTAVYGVFAGHYKRGESSIEALGNGEILIGSGVNVSIGDLLESAGDGTAKPQTGSNKDFFKSSTIAKVTSTVKIDTHSDGSYTVPCTLHCG